MHFLFARFIPAIAYLIGLTIILLLPGSTFDAANPDWFHKYQMDKLVHIVLFAALVFLFCRPIQLKGHLTSVIRGVYITILVIAVIYGVVIEIIQMSIPQRGFDVWDIVADLVGAYIGYKLSYNILKKQKPATLSDLKKEAMDYVQDKVGDKINLNNFK